MFYGKELSGELGTHEIQLFYYERKRMSPLYRETSFLLKNIYADVHGVKAGWFWAKGFKSKFVLGHLQWLCINEGDENVRIGCIRLLKQLWSNKTEEIISQNVISTNERIRLEALSILGELGSEKCLSILDKAETNEDTAVQKAVKQAKLAILSRNNPTNAALFIKQFIDDKATGSAFASAFALINIMPKMKLDGLKRLRNHDSKEIRRLAITELAKRGKLDNNEIEVLKNESDVELRYLGYKALIDKGEKLNIEEVRKSWPTQNAPSRGSLFGFLTYSGFIRLNEVIAMILKNYSVEELEKSLIWTSPDREFLYLELGLRKGREFLEQVRKDLDNKFERIKKDYIDQLNNLLLVSKKINDSQSANSVQAIIDKFSEESHEYGENALTRSALKILIENGEKEDIRFARQFMKSEDAITKDIAIELLVKLAGKDELSSLVDIAFNNTGGIKDKAACKALSLGNNGSVLEKFIKSNSKTLVKLGLKEKLKKKKILEREKIEKLLLNKDNDIREITVAYLMKELEQRRSSLEQVLDKYLENDSYYYNVVCWLDRILYAPRTFKMIFRKQLAAKLD